jgi:NAD(P)-dependent dehydrogenase (short-subunit alcohol dehydrogenase family)
VGLHGRRALVTGGASGIGRATARRLLAEGATVAIADLGPDRAREAARDLAGEGDVFGLGMDVTDPAQVEGQTAAAAERMGGLDMLVTSAGVTHPGTAWETTLTDWNRLLAVNLTGTFLCVRAAAPVMIGQGRGRIVMLASITGSHVWSERAAYAASKGGVIALAKSCAADLARHGITVNSVSPGPIATPQTAALHSQRIRDVVVSRTPLRRYGTPEEVAAVIAFLCSDDARHVTGHDLRVDGGLTAAAILLDPETGRS